MNKKLLIIALFVAIATVGTIAYFKYLKSGDQLRVIPKDASMVVSIDLKSLAEKAQPEKFKSMKFYKKMSEETAKDTDAMSRIMKKVAQSPTVTGINFLQNMYYFMADRNDKTVMGVTATLLNKKSFEDFLDSVPGKKPVTDKGNYRYINPENKLYIAWDSKSALLLVIDDTTMDSKGYLDELMNQGASGSITSNDKFNKFNTHKGDVTAFYNCNQIYKSMNSYRSGMKMVSPPAFLTDFYKSTYAGLCLNFEKNSIVLTNYAYYDNKYNDEQHKVLKSKGLSGDEMNCITDKNIYGFFSFSIDPKKIMTLLEGESTVSEMLTEMQSQLGLSKDDVKNLLGGDMTFALTDVRNTVVTRPSYDFDSQTGQMTQKQITDTSMMPMFTLSASINDRAVLHKIIDKTGIQKTGDYYKISIPYFTDVCVVETSTGVSLTNDQPLADKLSKNKSLTAVPDKVKGLLADNPISMYMDFDLNDYPQVIKDKMQKSIGEEYYSKFTNVMSLFKDMKGSGNMQEGRTELTLADGSDNSLYRIIEKIDANVNY